MRLRFLKMLIFFIFVPKNRRLDVYWYCEDDIKVGIVFIAINGLSFTDKGPV